MVCVRGKEGINAEATEFPQRAGRVGRQDLSSHAAGKDAGVAHRGAAYVWLHVVLSLLAVGSKPAPLKSTRVRHPAGMPTLPIAVWLTFGCTLF
jgi:hypothetical protein